MFCHSAFLLTPLLSLHFPFSILRMGSMKTMFFGCCLRCSLLAAVIYSSVFRIHELQSGMGPRGCGCSAHVVAQQ